MLHFRLSCVVALSLSGIWSGQLLAVPYTFDPSMLDGGNSMVDLSLFEEGAQMPGIYPVNIVLGEEIVDRRNLAFHLQREPDGKRSLQPCLTVEQLSRYGIRTEKYPGLATGGGEEGGVQCARINAIPQGSMTFAFFRQQLIISVPQAAIWIRLICG
jgi:outer membrane usher protein